MNAAAENALVLVGGASSQIGVFLLPALLKAGYCVRALSRRVDGTVDLGDGLVWSCPDRERGAATARAEASGQPRLLVSAGPLVVDRHGQAMRGTLRRFPEPWRSLMQFSGLWRLGRRWPVFQGVEPVAGLPTAVTDTEAVSGACMLLRRAAFERLGGLDPDYGLHCEDLELMYRLREAGQVSLFGPAARVYHLQGLSSRSRPLWVHWQKHRGMQRFFSKFQAERYARPLRWGIVAAIWARFALTLPLALLRR